jgi:hypothetical protein
MKKRIIFLTFIFLLALSACKKGTNERMTIVRDCTGTYLRQDSKDYHVCNTDRLSSFSNGEIVIATYKRIETCSGSAMHEYVCKMYHQTVGWIEVETIK